MIEVTQAQAFWRLVEIRSQDACWPWLGKLNSNGYAMLSTRRGSHMALELSGTPRPDSLCALHSCDNPSCVNPGHLRWGTNKQNVADMIDRKRHHASRRTHCIRGHLFSGSNLSIRPNGQRRCRQCGIEQRRQHHNAAIRATPPKPDRLNGEDEGQ